MTFDNDRARSLWAATRVRLWPAPVVLASLPVEQAAAAADLVARVPGGFSALVVERDEVSLTLPEDLWGTHSLRAVARSVAGPFRVLTFDLELELDVCGYLAPAAAALAAAGVPIVPQCAFRTDHILVPAERSEVAARTLDTLVAEARQAR